MTGRREQGVEFGEFGDYLEGATYPTTTARLVEEHGDRVLGLPSGQETVRETLGSLEEEYGSPEEVRQSVYNMVGIDAVGRKRYTDRDPPVTGEPGVGRRESF